MKELLIICNPKKTDFIRKEWNGITLYFYFKYVLRTYLHINFQFLVHNMNVDIPFDVRSNFFLRSKYRVLSHLSLTYWYVHSIGLEHSVRRRCIV